MDPLEFYATQSPFSDPGRRATMFDGLPEGLDALCGIVQGVYRHYLASGRLSQERRREVDTRYVDKILARIATLDGRPLTVVRKPEKRFVGCCRDAALLLCSILRRRGTPARIRVGFATYLRIDDAPGFNPDHVVTEVWDGARWKLVDPEQSADLVRRNRIDFNVHDIPRDRFLVGGAAWQMCRNGEMRADDFGLHPKDFFKGLWAIRNRLILDLAALNRVEPLLWDTWGWMAYGAKLSEADLLALDRIAAVTAGSDFGAMRSAYADPRFSMPRKVDTYSPVAGPGRSALRAVANP